MSRRTPASVLRINKRIEAMTSQLDWVGETAAPQQFKDIRNQRPSVAEEKAEKALQLGRLCLAIPPHIKSGGSINNVRSWTMARNAAAKVAANKRASVSELSAAISNMERFSRGDQ